jgi:hypothetical protein
MQAPKWVERNLDIEKYRERYENPLYTQILSFANDLQNSYNYYIDVPRFIPKN